MMTNQTSSESKAYTGIAVLLLFGLAIASNHLNPGLAAGQIVRPAIEDPVAFSTIPNVRPAILRMPVATLPAVNVIDRDDEQCL